MASEVPPPGGLDLDPAIVAVDRDVGVEREAELLGVELDRPVLIADRNGNTPNLVDNGLAACLCHLCLLKIGYAN